MQIRGSMNYQKLKELYPTAAQGIIDVLERELNKLDWSDDNKCHFLAQCAHESGGFRILRENLNYSEQALRRVFPKYFTPEMAKQYARKPDAIADIVYANRMGNGSSASHDGSRFKGRGLIQLTGKSNYASFDHENDPEFLETPEGAVQSAIWFWTRNKLYLLNDIKQITRKVNGGYNGLEDRTNQYNRISKAIK